jgi:hypothetical protein
MKPDYGRNNEYFKRGNRRKRIQSEDSPNTLRTRGISKI